jgi:hypothetical protein
VSSFCQPTCEPPDFCRVTIWIDAQFSPRMARWIEETFEVGCRHVRDIGLREAEDPEIYRQARDAGAVVMTKDEDFVHRFAFAIRCRNYSSSLNSSARSCGRGRAWYMCAQETIAEK